MTTKLVSLKYDPIVWVLFWGPNTVCQQSTGKWTGNLSQNRKSLQKVQKQGKVVKEITPFLINLLIYK